ncbi:MAG: DUF2207 domain-containing protein, partial [Chloroflexi bacterium]|nr:DUF2207 domain-containing protein [Chloroflexota bacterium]
MRKHLLWFVFFIGLLTPQHTIQAQEDVGYLRYDTHIFLEEDGSFIVMEIQQLQFNGAFHNGFAEIPLDYVVGIEDITVAGGSDLDSLTPYQLNGGGPNSYTTERDGDVIYVDWEFPETQPGDTLTFTLQYKVLGGLWVYPQTDTLEWRAVPAERGFPVPASWVVVNLPFTVATDALDYTAFGPASTVETIETETGQQIVFNAAEPIPDGVAFQVLVDFPHGLVAAEPQAWQIAADTAVLAYSLDNIDVEMVVGEDGRLHIAERRQVTIQEGVMYGGYREISWLYLDGVGDVSLAEGDAVFTFVPDAAPLCDYCAQTMTEARYSRWAQYSEWQDRVTISDDWAGQTAVRWQFPPLVKGETTTFTLAYTVVGAISVNEDNQRLSWTVVPGYETAVGETAVHLQLPGDMGLEDIAIEGGAAQRKGGAILITPEQPPQADEAWQIAITLPPGATTA